jgi:hypothetical protein
MSKITKVALIAVLTLITLLIVFLVSISTAKAQPQAQCNPKLKESAIIVFDYDNLVFINYNLTDSSLEICETLVNTIKNQKLTRYHSIYENQKWVFGDCPILSLSYYADRDNLVFFHLPLSEVLMSSSKKFNIIYDSRWYNYKHVTDEKRNTSLVE